MHTRPSIPIQHFVEHSYYRYRSLVGKAWNKQAGQILHYCRYFAFFRLLLLQIADYHNRAAFLIQEPSKLFHHVWNGTVPVGSHTCHMGRHYR